MSEQLSIIAVDGSELVFSGDWMLEGYDGFGWPPLKWVTSQGTYQHGATLEGQFLESRIVTLRATRFASTRAAMWTARGDFWKAVSTYPLSPLRLRKTFEDGSQRQLDCFLDQDPGSRQAGMGGTQRHEIKLIAFDPLWYNPTLTVDFFAVTGGAGNVTFPITFPITFGSSIINVTSPISYPGTWYAEPTIVATGPLHGLIIQNLSTIEKLDFATKVYDIIGGETVTIVCKFGQRSVTSSINGNIRRYLSNDSNLATFHVGAPPEVPGGINSIHVEGHAADANTLVRFEYNVRYIAI